jgi:septum formation protein
MSRLILASTSPYRRALLQRLGIPFEVMKPPFDEEAAKPALAHLDVESLSLALARGKTLSVSKLDPEAVVIGSDQIATIDGERLDKPGTHERACAQLKRLRGRSHRLVTALVIARGDQVIEHVDAHTLFMRDLSDAQIEDYVRRDKPLDCAGSYKIESLGVALLERVVGEDASAIEGLPLMTLISILERFGVRVLG